MIRDGDDVRKVLSGLSQSPDRIVYTEHFLQQITKRKIMDVVVEDLLENGNPVEIKRVEGYRSRFELMYSSSDLGNLAVVVSVFNDKSVILISAFAKGGGEDCPKDMAEFECIFDFAFDLVDIHTADGFRYCRTVEVEQGLNVDFDSYGSPVAIEIIGASKKFRLHSEKLRSASFDGWIEVTGDLIRIGVNSHVEGMEARTLEREIPNDYGFRQGRFEFG